MKVLLIHFLLLFTLMTAGAQSAKEIIKAFETNNTNYILTHLDNKVEISLDGKNNSFDKAGGGKFLTDFFNNNRISSFRTIHQSESRGTAYIIGNLITSGGQYRTTLFIKEVNGRSVIQEIKLEQ